MTAASSAAAVSIGAAAVAGRDEIASGGSGNLHTEGDPMDPSLQKRRCGWRIGGGRCAGAEWSRRRRQGWPAGVGSRSRLARLASTSLFHLSSPGRTRKNCSSKSDSAQALRTCPSGSSSSPHSDCSVATTSSPRKVNAKKNLFQINVGSSNFLPSSVPFSETLKGGACWDTQVSLLHRKLHICTRLGLEGHCMCW